MKKLLTAMSLVLGLGLATAQQTAPATASKTAPAMASKTAQQAPKTVKATEAKMATKSTSAEGMKMKKDGTPDKRYKANKNLKKDGTPDKRYKANK